MIRQLKDNRLKPDSFARLKQGRSSPQQFKTSERKAKLYQPTPTDSGGRTISQIIAVMVAICSNVVRHHESKLAGGTTKAIPSSMP